MVWLAKLGPCCLFQSPPLFPPLSFYPHWPHFMLSSTPGPCTTRFCMEHSSFPTCPGNSLFSLDFPMTLSSSHSFHLFTTFSSFQQQKWQSWSFSCVFLCITRWQGLPRRLSVKEPTCQYRRCRRRWARSQDGKEPLEKEMATHTSILAWKIPWTEESGGLQSMGSQSVGHD